MPPLVQVRLPPPLAALHGSVHARAHGATVLAVLEAVGRQAPHLALHLFDEAGHVRPQIICLHRGEIVRAKSMAARAVEEGDEIALTNALAAG